MSVLLSALATSMLSAPVPGKNVSKALLREYPTSAVARNKSAAALVEFWVDPKGKVYQCKTLTFLGDEKLASEACRILLKSSVRPARDVDDMAAYGRVRTVVSFFIPSTKQGREVENAVGGPDLVLSVNRLPAGSEGELSTELVALVDTEGRIVQCEFSEKAPADYARAACDSLSANQLPKGLDKQGSPVPYVTSLNVRFTESSEASQQ